MITVRKIRLFMGTLILTTSFCSPAFCALDSSLDSNDEWGDVGDYGEEGKGAVGQEAVSMFRKPAQRNEVPIPPAPPQRRPGVLPKLGGAGNRGAMLDQIKGLRRVDTYQPSQPLEEITENEPQEEGEVRRTPINHGHGIDLRTLMASRRQGIQDTLSPEEIEQKMDLERNKRMKQEKHTPGKNVKKWAQQHQGGNMFDAIRARGEADSEAEEAQSSSSRLSHRVPPPPPGGAPRMSVHANPAEGRAALLEQIRQKRRSSGVGRAFSPEVEPPAVSGPSSPAVPSRPVKFKRASKPERVLPAHPRGALPPIPKSQASNKDPRDPRRARIYGHVNQEKAMAELQRVRKRPGLPRQNADSSSIQKFRQGIE